MASNLDIYISSDGNGIISGGSVLGNDFPVLYRNDILNVRLRIMDVSEANLAADATLVSPSFKIGIGLLDKEPKSGEFKLITTTGTSNAISYNATTTQVLNAVSSIAGNVSVDLFGTDGSAWVIQAATANTALSFTASSFTLFPDSTVQITTRRTPAASIKAEQIIELRQNAYVESSSFSTASTANAITLYKIQDGSSTKNETYKLAITKDAIGGNFAINFTTPATALVPINQVQSNAIQIMMNSISGLSSSNIQVDAGDNNNTLFVISFKGSLGLQDVTTALTLDSAGVIFAQYYSTTLTLSGSGIESLFADYSTDQVTAVLEIQMTDGGQTKTLLQRSIKVARDLLNS